MQQDADLVRFKTRMHGSRLLMNSEPATPQQTDIYWFAVVTLAVLNFLIALVAKGADVPWLVVFFSGLVWGEWNWLAVWAVLGPSPWNVRLLEVLSGMLALGGGFLCGTVILYNSIDPSDFRTTVCLLPLAFLATQSPLWLFRFLLGWRIRANRRAQGSVLDDARRFELRHIFAATAMVATSLGTARAADTPPGLLPGMLFALPVLSLLTAAPCVWTGMVVADAMKANLYAAIFGLVLAGIGPAYVLLIAHGPFWELFLPMCGFFCGMLIVVHGTLRLIRAAGFTLTAPRTIVNGPFTGA